MRPAQLLLNAAKKQGGSQIPVELTPLFIAVGVALCSGTYFTFKKFSGDESLRVVKNPEQSGLKDVLKKED